MPDFVGFLVTFAPTMNSERKRIGLAVLAAALGYFVDAYDLILYNIVRVQSLRGIGVPEAALLGTGVDLLNAQLIGMLAGGVLWGVLGDRRGRRSVLFGSIFLYSAATLANGLIHTLPAYRFCRLLAGVGLAGELGAGVTLVAELLPKQTRGYGTMIVAAVGVIGVVTASLVAGTFTWRTAYLIGGGLGILLLFLRIGVTESGLFAKVCERPVSRGNFFALFTRWVTFKKYLSVVMVALPIWVIIGVLITFSPELGRDMGLVPPPQAGRAVLWYYLGLTVGDLTTGYLSQRFANRKRVMAVFLAITGVVGAAYFTFGGHSLGTYYSLCWRSAGPRATGPCSSPCRPSSSGPTCAPLWPRPHPISSAVRPCRSPSPSASWGHRSACVTRPSWSQRCRCLIGAAALRSLDETYGKDLDFVE
jgi:MFS family permease